ncbi:MAG: YraN family protein [Bacteroidia bacterium]|nr:YraN family protein [Bacteroidia bacterium]
MAIFFISLNLQGKIIDLNTLDKKHAISKGQKGEKKIQDFLTKRGYRILDTNFRYGKKEIDIIALSPEDTLVFVEVKSRKTDFEENPAWAVTLRKQRNIISAAHYYILSRNLDPKEIRFDIATVVESSSSSEITYIENAYYPHAS